MNSLLNILLSIINLAFEVYFWLIIIRVLLSWFPAIRNPVFRSFAVFVYEITEPYLGLIRKYIPVVSAGAIGIDFSPFVGIILLELIERAVVQVIYWLM
jgi:YggT family protein